MGKVSVWAIVSKATSYTFLAPTWASVHLIEKDIIIAIIPIILTVNTRKGSMMVTVCK